VLLPAWNEELGLEATLTELRAVDWATPGGAPDVLMVDGRSTDGTVEVARRFDVPVLVQATKGKGAAVREGLAWASEREYGSVAVLDADGTYPCDRIPVLLGLLNLGHDVVVGVRRPTRPANSTVRDLVHRIGNGVLNLTAANLARGPILDVCSGFWGIRMSILPRLDLRSDGFEIESELMVKAVRERMRVVHVPVDYRPRIGTAKLHAVRDGARIFLSIARHSRASTPRRAPTIEPWPRDVVRDLATTLLALGPPPVAVVGPPSRAKEAAELAGILRPYGAGVETVRVRPGGGPGPDGAVLPSSAPPPDWYLERGTGVVLLPEVGGPGVPDGSALVELPKRGHRLLLTPWIPAGRRSIHVSISGGLGPFDPPVAGHGLSAPGSAAILAATIESRGPRRLETMLRANVATSRLQVVPVPPEREWPNGESDERLRPPAAATWSFDRREGPG
jgi:hypothetical protein